MNGLQCPVCEEQIPFEDDEGKRSLSQLLGAGISTAVADHTEELLRKHLEEHTVEDFVTALVMADRYIALVEAERDDAVQWRKDVEARIAQGPVLRPSAPGPDPRQFQGTPPPPAPYPPGQDFGAGYVQPEMRPRRQAVDPDRTLIPHVPAGMRPEGVVGRRT